MTRFATLLLLLALGITPLATADYFPGARTLLDAHNCYPYFNLWSNRIERALACPLPISIEMDQVWDNGDGKHAPRAVLAHSGPFSGK